jgi:hypothetical protein
MSDSYAEFKIVGGFNEGLKATQGKTFLMKSEVLGKYFASDEIHIFGKGRRPLLKVTQKTSLLKADTYTIDFRSDEFQDVNWIQKSEINFGDNNCIEFKHSNFPFFGFPYAKIYHDGAYIGKIKRKNLATNLQYTLFLQENALKYLDYVLVHLLVNDSNKDYDHEMGD